MRSDPETGKATFAIIQAEDELAALGMVIGAGWAGARAMTSTSGPGLSLMAEFAGLAYFAEIPAVIWDIQRIGPSTGLPTRTSQGDILAAYYLSHGDTRHVMLFPGSPKECFEFGALAFDLAERLQTPVFVLSDLDLGMNVWISDPFEYPEKPMDRGKVLDATTDLQRLGNCLGPLQGCGRRRHPLSHAARQPATTRPPTSRAAPATTNTPATPRGPEDWERNLDRLARKFETARDAGARAGGARCAPDARVSASSAWARTTRPCLRRVDLLREAGHREPATCACGHCRSARRCATSSAATNGSTSWRTTTTASCTRFC